ncbi:YadA-like family protein [Vibrio maritimus]|uniref:YadA-like family protein n=1 Tax=Vibrio maritimus TaxID=990268 RepID=UPI004069075D
MKKTIIAIALTSTFSGAVFANDCNDDFIMGCAVEDAAGSVTGGAIAAIAPREVRDDLRKYTDSDVPLAERHAMAANYVKGLADGSISEKDAEAASGLYVKFKDGKAQDLNSSLIADGLTHMVNNKEISYNDVIGQDENGKNITVNDAINAANANRIDGAEGIDKNLGTIQGEVDRRNDQQDHNTGDIGRLGNMVGEANKSIGVIGKQVETNTGQIDANKKDIKTLGEVVGDTNKSIGKIGTRIDEEVRKQGEWNKSAEKTVGGIAEDIQRNSEAAERAEKASVRNTTRIDDIEQGAKEYDEQIRGEFDQWEKDAKKYVDDKIENGRQGRDSNSERIDENRRDIRNNTDQIAKNDKAISDANGRINDTNKRLDATNEQVDKNAKAIDVNRKGIKDNVKRIDSIEKDNVKRDQKIDSIGKKADENSKRIDDTNSRITDEVAKQDKVNKDAAAERKTNSDNIAKNGEAIKDTNKRLDATNEQVDKNAKNIDANKKRIDEELENQDKVNKQANADREENRNKITDTNKRIDDEIAIGDEFARQASDVVVSNADKISENSQQISRNSVRIDNLEDALVRQGEEMRERYDGVKASTHAAMSARAFTSEPGEFAVGAGIGAAGSKRALAIGGAYQFNENWSGNFIGSYETAGKYTKSDLALGVGAQYTFK